MKVTRISRRLFVAGSVAMGAAALSACAAPAAPAPTSKPAAPAPPAASPAAAAPAAPAAGASPAASPAAGASPAAAASAPAPSAAAPSSAAAQANTAKPASGKLLVGTWGGIWENAFKKEIGPRFQQSVGFDLEYDIASSEERLAKVRAQQRNQLMDAAMLTPEAMTVAAADNLMQPLPDELIPNLASVYPRFKEPFVKDGKTFAVPISWSATGILWREDLVPFEITKWTDLWRPELKNRVSIQQMPTLGAASFIITAAMVHGGTPDNVEPGFEALARLKQNIKMFFTVSSDVLNQLVSGEIWAAVTIADQGVPYRDRKVRITVPEEGTTYSMQAIGIPTGAKNPEATARLIDFLLGADTQVEWTRATKVAPTSSRAQLPADIQSGLVETEAVVNRLWPVNFQTMGRQMQDWTERWNREITS